MNAVLDVARSGGGPSAAASRWRRERRFFSVLAAAAAVTIFIGFAPTYYLKSVYGTPALPRLVHFHGILFTSWILLLLTQTTLVAVGRTDVHRRLGVAGAALAALMTMVGLATAIGAVQRGSMTLDFLTVPLATVVVFPLLVGAAVVLRRQPDAHKRLIMIATAEVISAGTARLPGLGAWGPLGFFGLVDLVIVALVAYDVVTRGRVHAATLWGGLFLIASQPLRLMIGGTDTWRVFASWLTS